MEGNENRTNAGRSRTTRPVRRSGSGSGTGNRNEQERPVPELPSLKELEEMEAEDRRIEKELASRPSPKERAEQREREARARLARKRAEQRAEQRRKNREEKTREEKDKGEKRPKNEPVVIDMKVVGAIIGAVILLGLVIFGVRSCGATHRSPGGVMRELYNAAIKGNTKKMKDCYGIEGDAMVDMQQTIESMTAYFAAHNAAKMQVVSMNTLFEEGDYTCITMISNLVLDNDQKYPFIRTEIMQNVEGKYYVLTPSKVTDDLSQRATAAYNEFLSTEAYKTYEKEYDTFIKKNPGYEDKISAKIG